MSLMKGNHWAAEKAFQKALKGMRQKMRRKITTVRTTGTPRAQTVRRRATTGSAGGSGTRGSHILGPLRQHPVHWGEQCVDGQSMRAGVRTGVLGAGETRRGPSAELGIF